MGDLGPRCGAGQAGDAGVAEQVQDPGAAPGLRQVADPRVQPLPVGGLLGEEGQVSERGEPAGEPHVAPGQRKGVDRLAREPPASGLVLVVGIEHGVGAVEGLRIARRPQALRLGPDDGVATIALQLPAIAAVQQGIVGPGAWSAGFRAWAKGREAWRLIRRSGGRSSSIRRRCVDRRPGSGRCRVLSQAKGSAISRQTAWTEGQASAGTSRSGSSPCRWRHRERQRGGRRSVCSARRLPCRGPGR